MATTIDALGLAEDFEKAGFPRDQAIGMARAIRDHSHETLATKADLHDLELRLEARFEQIDARFVQIDQRFEHLEQKWDERFAHLEQKFDARFVQIEQHFEHLEQKSDRRFVSLEEKWDERLQKVNVGLREELGRVQIGMIKWFAGMMVAQATAIVALLKLLPGAAP